MSIRGVEPVSVPARFTHTGFRYVLGLDDASYAIWDRAAPDEPFERFDPTPQGWANAWRRFSKLEPRAETLGEDTTKLTDARPIAVVQSLRAPSRFARITLAVAGVAAVASGVSHLFQARLLARVVDGERVPFAEAMANDQRQALIAGLFFAAILGAILAWLVWQHRAHSNLRGLEVQNLRFTPGWAVGWWFIPFVNLVAPFLTMRELDRASDPVADRYRWNLGRTSPLLVAWWGAWLLAGALSFYVRAELDETPGSPFVPGPETPQELLGYSYRLAASGFVAAVAAILAILVVTRITRRQTQKAAVAGTPTVPGTIDPGVPTFTHTGFRYVLGHDALGYGIWERERAGDPVERWGRDDASWSAAWARFTQLEPHGAALERPFVPGPEPAVARDADGSARAVLTLGIASAALGILFAGVLLGPITLIAGAAASTQAVRASDPERARGRIRTGMVLGGIGLALSIGMIVVANLA